MLRIIDKTDSAAPVNVDNLEVIEHLSNLLDQANSGDIVAFAYVATRRGGHGQIGMSGIVNKCRRGLRGSLLDLIDLLKKD